MNLCFIDRLIFVMFIISFTFMSTR